MERRRRHRRSPLVLEKNIDREAARYARVRPDDWAIPLATGSGHSPPPRHTRSHSHRSIGPPSRLTRIAGARHHQWRHGVPCSQRHRKSTATPTDTETHEFRRPRATLSHRPTTAFCKFSTGTRFSLIVVLNVSESSTLNAVIILQHFAGIPSTEKQSYVNPWCRPPWNGHSMEETALCCRAAQ